MANALYDKARNHFAMGDIKWKQTGGDTFKVLLVDSASYTADLANHEFLTSIPAGARRGNAGGQTLADFPTITIAADPVAGVCDGNDVTITAVPTGGPYEYIAIIKDGGSDAASLLIALIDTATGLPVTTNGGNITIQWSDLADKIFKL